MYEQLRIAQTERETTEELISKQITEEFKRIDEEIEQEQKAREEQEEVMLEMLRDVI